MSNERRFHHVPGEEQPPDDTADDQLPEHDPSLKEILLRKAREDFEGFFLSMERTINGYFGTPDIPFTVRPGGWYVVLEPGNIRVNADPKFFLERQYTRAESMFATFHEAEHFRDMIQDADAYAAMFERLNATKEVHEIYPKILKKFYNCLDDILVNKVVMSRWHDGIKAKNTLYPKLFPNRDFRRHPSNPNVRQPRTRQFMYALLRKHMLPHEEVMVEDDVREAIERCEKSGGSNGDFLRTLTSVTPEGKARFQPQDRYYHIEKSIEPIIKELFLKDLADPQIDLNEEDPLNDSNPDALDYEDAADQAKRARDAAVKERNEKFKQREGIDKKDFEIYRRDFIKIEPQIAKLSGVFDSVITRRKTRHRKLRGAHSEGVMPDPKRLATAVAEIKSGNFEPKVMLDFESEIVIRNIPTKLEFTIVGDGSGSMASNGKDLMQRKLMVLALEALADLNDRIKKAELEGEKIDLTILTEARIFESTDHLIKPLSPSLTHAERVIMHKQLRELPKGDNNEMATFDRIMNTEFFDPTRIRELREGKLVKVILFLSDGQTNVEEVQKKIKELYRLAGKAADGTCYLVIAGIGFGDGVEIKETYAPHGYFANSFDEVPEIFKKFLADLMNRL